MKSISLNVQAAQHTSVDRSSTLPQVRSISSSVKTAPSPSRNIQQSARTSFSSVYQQPNSQQQQLPLPPNRHFHQQQHHQQLQYPNPFTSELDAVLRKHRVYLYSPQTRRTSTTTTTPAIKTNTPVPSSIMRSFPTQSSEDHEYELQSYDFSLPKSVVVGPIVGIQQHASPSIQHTHAQQTQHESYQSQQQYRKTRTDFDMRRGSRTTQWVSPVILKQNKELTQKILLKIRQEQQSFTTSQRIHATARLGSREGNRYHIRNTQTNGFATLATVAATGTCAPQSAGNPFVTQEDYSSMLIPAINNSGKSINFVHSALVMPLPTTTVRTMSSQNRRVRTSSNQRRRTTTIKSTTSDPFKFITTSTNMQQNHNNHSLITHYGVNQHFTDAYTNSINYNNNINYNTVLNSSITNEAASNQFDLYFYSDAGTSD